LLQSASAFPVSSLNDGKERRADAAGVTQVIRGHGPNHFRNQFTHDSALEHSSLDAVTGFLNAALRIWDDDRTQAKSQIKIAAAMLRGYTDQSVPGMARAAASSDRRGLAPWQTRQVKEFIETSLDSTIRIRDCARTARLSAGYFSRAFKATFGMTVCRYIRGRRIKRAQQLMLTSAQSLAQIAFACGFSDQSHYSRVFRDVVGQSPNVWRRRNMNLAPDK
jgi:AraC-like DNA-binding protein